MVVSWRRRDTLVSLVFTILVILTLSSKFKFKFKSHGPSKGGYVRAYTLTIQYDLRTARCFDLRYVDDFSPAERALYPQWCGIHRLSSDIKSAHPPGPSHRHHACEICGGGGPV